MDPSSARGSTAATRWATGSEEEVEIQACAVTACERIAALIRQEDPAFLTRDLDYLLWNRGQLPRYRVTPSHRVRTIYY